MRRSGHNARCRRPAPSPCSRGAACSPRPAWRSEQSGKLARDGTGWSAVARTPQVAGEFSGVDPEGSGLRGLRRSLAGGSVVHRRIAQARTYWRLAAAHEGQRCCWDCCRPAPPSGAARAHRRIAQAHCAQASARAAGPRSRARVDSWGKSRGGGWNDSSSPWRIATGRAATWPLIGRPSRLARSTSPEASSNGRDRARMSSRVNDSGRPEISTRRRSMANSVEPLGVASWKSSRSWITPLATRRMPRAIAPSSSSAAVMVGAERAVGRAMEQRARGR